MRFTMNKHKDGKDTSRAGSSLVLVMCLMAGITVLCLAVLLAAYSLNRRIHLREDNEIARSLAESAGGWFSEELTGSVYRGRPGNPEKSVFDYVGYWILDPENGWPDYDAEGGANHSQESARRTFQAEAENRTWPEEAGMLQIILYWTMEEGDSFEDMQIRLVMEVTCFYGERSADVTKVFEKIVCEEGSPSEAGREDRAASDSEGRRRPSYASESSAASDSGLGNDSLLAEDWKAEGRRSLWKWAEVGSEETDEISKRDERKNQEPGGKHHDRGYGEFCRAYASGRDGIPVFPWSMAGYAWGCGAGSGSGESSECGYSG